MKLNKQRIDEIKKYHKISEQLRLEIASADFSKSSDDFSKIFFALSVLSAQQWSTRIQKVLTEKLNMEYVFSDLGCGDCMDNKNNFYYEIKCSVITETNNTLNIVQIREWEKLEGYFICGIDLRNEKIKLYKFFLSKKEMKYELKKVGQSAHGIKKIAKENKNHEKAIRLKVDKNNEHFLRWQKKYSKNIILKNLK